MKTLTTYAKYFTPISKITFLFCFLLGNIAEANTKRANFSPSLGIKRTYTYTFEGSSDMIASATTPELIFFSKARDNSAIDNTFFSHERQQWSVFNNWINTTVSGNTGYSFEGFSCTSSPCPQMQLPLRFILDTAILEATAMRSIDGQVIFRIRQHPEIGVSFQLGKNYKGDVEWLNNQPQQDEFPLTTLRISFGDSANVSFQLRAKLHLLTLPTSYKDIPMMKLTLGKIKLQKWEARNQGPSLVSYIVQDTGSLNVQLNTPRILLMQQQRQCTVNNASVSPNSVTLQSVKKRELETQSEMEGGTFKLRVNCGNTTYNKANGKWLFPAVEVTFTGENSTENNGANDLLHTKTGDGQAKGVSLRIRRSNNDSVKYGEGSPEINNPGQFALQKQPSSAGGDQSAEETFKVDYVKDQTRGTLTEGKVNAAATFTMSYQ